MLFYWLRQFLVDLLFPKTCVGCSNEGTYLCNECLSKVDFLTSQVCPGCKKNISSFGLFCGEKCSMCFNFQQLIVCSEYSHDSVVKKLIVLFKYKFSEEVCAILGEILRTQFVYFSQYLDFFRSAVLVPVPLHRKRLKYRGFNQAALLAKYLWSRIKDDPLLNKNFVNLEYWNCMGRQNFYKQQAVLNRAERLQNLKDSFFVKEDFLLRLRGKNILLIDDVATTGATLSECAKALRQCDVKHVAGFVLARG